MMGKWSDESAFGVVHDVLLYSVLDTVVIYGEDDCYSVMFGTLVGVFVFSVMWSEFLITSANCCPLWSSVYKCHKVECAFISPVRTECGMFVMCCMQCCRSMSAVMCTLTIWSFVLCVWMAESMYVVVNVMLSLMSVMSPPPALRNLSVRTVVKLCTLGVWL